MAWPHLNVVIEYLITLVDAPSAYENETTKLWKYFFKYIFKGDEWIISSQQAPAPAPPPLPGQPAIRRCVDLVVEKYTDRAVTRLLYLEAKRYDATQSEIRELEHQGYTAGVAHCELYNVKSISIITCIGSKAKLWVYCQGDTFLTQLFPLGDAISARDEYVFLSSEEGGELVRRLKYLRDHGIPKPSHTIKSNS